MSASACPKCGSKRTTEMGSKDGRPVAVWCHSCGTVSDKVMMEEVAIEEPETVAAVEAYLRG